MSKARRCPHCGLTLPVQSGYTFDQEMNIRCGKCGKVVFPATPAAETELLQSPPDPTFYKQSGFASRYDYDCEDV